ncbi:hypothetical protein MMC32_001817 [Xylographa parallela]|nr:hypothetical protein [Xylographa parallela]
MLFHFLFCATAALLLSVCNTSANAGHLRFHRDGLQRIHKHHQARHTTIGSQERHRPGLALVKRNTTAIQQLQSEVTSFSSSMIIWFTQVNATTSPAYISQLQNLIQPHQTWMSTWLETAASNQPEAQLQQLQADSTAFNGWMTAWFATYSAMDSSTAISLLQLEIETYEWWLSTWLITAGAGSVATPLPTVSSPVAVSSFASATPSSLAAVTLTGTIIATSATTAPTASTAPVSGKSIFNATAKDNVMVYFGASPFTGIVPLSQICMDSAVDIVTLAFVNGFFEPDSGGYPTVDFGAASGTTNAAQMAAGANGLLWCPDLASQIEGCQNSGKMVLLSLGGSTAAYNTFANSSQAESMASMLWNLFGGNSTTDVNLHNESGNSSYYAEFTGYLRSHFLSDPSKIYYLSGAPQCIYPDASLPLAAMLDMDFIWVQFFDNTPCNVGTPGFPASFQTWSNALNAGGKPMFYMMALATNPGTGSAAGYIDIGSLSDVIKNVTAQDMANFGGVGLWDGSSAVNNTNYQDGVKSALGGLKD